MHKVSPFPKTQMFTIENFPLPPSVNEYLMPSRGRLIKTNIHREYKESCLLHYYRNKLYFDNIKKTLNTIKDSFFIRGSTFALHVDYIYNFEKSRILTKNNQAKVLDTSNRLKPCSDMLAKLIGIDDKYFFSESIRKSIAGESGECTTIIITQIEM